MICLLLQILLNRALEKQSCGKLILPSSGVGLRALNKAKWNLSQLTGKFINHKTRTNSTTAFALAELRTYDRKKHD